LQRALRDRVLDAIFDDVRETLARSALIVAESLRVTCRILDAPLDVVIDDQAPILARQEGLPLETLRDDAPLELADANAPMAAMIFWMDCGISALRPRARVSLRR